MIEKYGNLNIVSVMSAENLNLRNKKISKSHTGKCHTEEHHKKVISSKRSNNTLNHTLETKLKIRDSLIKLYQSDNPPITVSDNSNKRHIHGYFNKIYYRSSYELLFLQQCDKQNIEVISAGTEEFRIRYTDETGKLRMYYPDFYLPKYSCVIEIKPESRLTDDRNQCKFHAASYSLQYENYTVITEEDLFNNNLWVDQIEYLLSI
jgi:hypothetical protein